MADAKDVGDWLGTSQHATFNFTPGGIPACLLVWAALAFTALGQRYRHEGLSTESVYLAWGNKPWYVVSCMLFKRPEAVCFG
eukprot:scaffold25417_cov22-Tisochrysis_lutea.AAC.8